MQVSMTYKNGKLQNIKFSDWHNERSRMARIDLDIVRAVGWCGAHTENDGNVIFFDRERGGEQIGFTNAEETKIKKVLAGYCITPEVKHTPDCNCQAEYYEACSLSSVSGK